MIMFPVTEPMAGLDQFSERQQRVVAIIRENNSEAREVLAGLLAHADFLTPSRDLQIASTASLLAFLLYITDQDIAVAMAGVRQAMDNIKAGENGKSEDYRISLAADALGLELD